MKYDKFLEAWSELSRVHKISCFNEWAQECAPDEEIFAFCDEFFEMVYGNNSAEAARACCFGVVDWSDEYIRFNGYGNLVSMNEYEAAEFADDHAAEIFEYDEIWKSYIEDEDEDEEGGE